MNKKSLLAILLIVVFVVVAFRFIKTDKEGHLEPSVYYNTLLGYSVVLPEGYRVAEEYTKLVNIDYELGARKYSPEDNFDIHNAEIIVFSPDSEKQQIETIEKAESSELHGFVIDYEPNYIYIEPEILNQEVRDKLNERIDENNPTDHLGYRACDIPLMFSTNNPIERICKDIIFDEPVSFYVSDTYGATGYEEAYGLRIVIPNAENARDVGEAMFKNLSIDK